MKTLFAAAAASLVFAALAACQKEGPAEKAGRQLDQAADKAGRSMERAGDKVRDAVK